MHDNSDKKSTSRTKLKNHATCHTPRVADSLNFSLYLITDRNQVRSGQTLFSVVEEALKGGVKAVQLREKDLSKADLYPLALEMRKLTSRYNAKLLINRHVDIALEVNADGVHLGGDAVEPAKARQRIGPDKLIGVSTHSMAEIIEATKLGADFVTFGPVYATPSKSIYGPAQGLIALAEACQVSSLPVFALGGIKTELIKDVLATGAYGVALISAIISSPDPLKAAQSFLA